MVPFLVAVRFRAHYLTLQLICLRLGLRANPGAPRKLLAAASNQAGPSRQQLLHHALLERARLGKARF